MFRVSGLESRVWGAFEAWGGDQDLGACELSGGLLQPRRRFVTS